MWIKEIPAAKIAIKKKEDNSERISKLAQTEELIQGWMIKFAEEFFIDYLQNKYGKAYIEILRAVIRECSICQTEDKENKVYVVTKCGHCFH